MSYVDILRLPPAGAAPIVPAISPSPAATMPLSGTRPARIATIDRPRTVIISISGKPKARISGRAMKMKKVRMSAPKRPPNSEDAKAADSARAAWPCLESGKPSSTVAWLAEEPGMPSSTEENVSEVGITATRPTISARPPTGSIPYMNGRTSASPAIPPSPGSTPIDSPSSTPPTRYISCSGRNSRANASPSASNAVAKMSKNGLRKKATCSAPAPAGAERVSPRPSLRRDAVILLEPIKHVFLGVGRDGRRLLGGLDRGRARLLRVDPERLLGDLGEVRPRLNVIEGGYVHVHNLLRRGARQEDRLLVREACDKERLPGIPSGAGRLAAPRRLADFLKRRQVRESRVAHDVPVLVERAPGEHRHSEVFLDERGHI